ncbi:hypothetical protein ACFWMG_05035 [Streptomyces sp. NPDC127074]|uniref:hypothetical protein n=1 Tax=Streptomyces sp. NPDC127074 TaxID=3347130 RepID=UPI00364D71AD
MARIRTIKPEFFTSLTVADLTPEQRLTFIGLWTHADDAGRCVDDPRLIKAAIWPLDDRTAADIEIDLKALSESSLITRYIVNRKRYIAVTNWREHQRINRPTASKLPPVEQGEQPDPEPPTSGYSDSRTPHGECSEPSPPERKGREQGREGNREGKGEGVAGVAEPSADPSGEAEPQRPDGLHLIPDDFYLNDTMRRWAVATFGQLLDPDFETEQFISYWRSEGRRKRNWHDAWQKWIRDSGRRAYERQNRQTSNVIALASGQPLPGPDTNLAGWAAVAASFDSEDSA